ncbi:hypothetical protein ACHAPX_001503 [Trichoderma viride]|jgi:hypothetical protein
MRRVVEVRMAEERRRGRGEEEEEEEEEEGESLDQTGRYAREKRAGRNNEWPGRGISFNPFYALGRAQATGTAGDQIRDSARPAFVSILRNEASQLRLRLVMMFGRQSLAPARVEAWSGDGCLALELVAKTLRRAIYVPQPKLERRRGYLRDYSGRGGGGSFWRVELQVPSRSS